MRKVQNADRITNADFAGGTEIRDLKVLIDYYGYAIEVEDGPDGEGDGLLIFVPGVSLTDIPTGKD
jgi:hypothetical protein